MGPKFYKDIPTKKIWDEGITIGEAAELAGVTAVCIMQWVNQGRDRVGKIPHGYRLVGTRPDGTRLYEIVVKPDDVELWRDKIAKSGRPSRLSSTQRNQIKTLRMKGKSLSQIGKRFGISESYVSLISRNLRG